MSFRRNILCLISAALICLNTNANERKFSFKHLNLDDGLSSMSINDIWTDPAGIVWLATSVGLDCYDGNSVQSFHPPKEISSQTNEIFTKQIIGDDKGHLYVMYSNCICILDRYTSRFEPFLSDVCNCIAYDEGLWVGKKN